MKKLLFMCTLSFWGMNLGFGQAAIDSNATCTKASFIECNQYYKDSGESYYKFVATSNYVNIKAITNYFIGVVLTKQLDPLNVNSCGIYDKGFRDTKGGSSTGVTNLMLPSDSLIIGNTYYVYIKPYDSKAFTLSIINGNKNDFSSFNANQLTENIPYNFNINNYSKGRETNYGNLPSCTTTKADSNTVDLFIKFKALASTMSLVLNVDNSNLESIIELTSSPNTCNKDFQIGKTQRNYSFSGLTVGNDYTARIEIGGDAALGFARMNGVNNASVVLKAGVVTDIESENAELTKTISNIYNLQGIEVTKEYRGMVIYKYSDGSSQKVVQY